MLVPVIGIVQVGVQSMADRYTYLPLVGISVALVWLFADIGEEWRISKGIFITIGCALFLCLGLCAFRQTAYWKSSQSLFEHALAVTDRNFTIHNNLGTVLERKGMFDDAMTHYREALSINDNFAEAHANLGFDLLRKENSRKPAPIFLPPFESTRRRRKRKAILGRSWRQREDSPNPLLILKNA